MKIKYITEWQNNKQINRNNTKIKGCWENMSVQSYNFIMQNSRNMNKPIEEK